MDYLKAYWKYILSFFKKDWQIEDYPLRYKIQKNVPENDKHLIRVINWWLLIGTGATKQQALESLRENFKNQVKIKGCPPRPGVYVPIQFATSQIINKHPDLTDDFIKRVLGLCDKDLIFLSDESSLYEFLADGEEIQTYLNRIQEIYEIDVSDIIDGTISRIIEKISSLHKKTTDS